jgi:DNA-directed RNA polymerase subunit M/transcription elongation factor TFIIS
MVKHTVTCRQCGESLTVAAEAIGRKASCFKCGAVLVVPSAEEEAAYREGLRQQKEREREEARRTLEAEEEGRRRREAERERDRQQTLEIMKVAREREGEEKRQQAAPEEEKRQQAAAAAERWRAEQEVAHRRDNEDPWPAEAIVAYVSAWGILVFGVVAAIVIWASFGSVTDPTSYGSHSKPNPGGILLGFVALLAYTAIASLLFCAGKAVRLLARRQTR